jgi:NitT/TauT family transport system ATP-binding protein
MVAEAQVDVGAKAPVIEARGLDLTFQTADGPVQALRDVNLQINKGDFVSFIGPSGCGKTTFLRVVAALEHPTGGEITVNGMTPDEARRKRAYGYVFQAAGLYPWRSIEKNIMLPLEIMGFDRVEQERRVKDVLQLVDLEGFGKKFPWQLSGGMQQRASIARALAFDADLLLMDEPFGALDEIVRDHLNEQLLALLPNGRRGRWRAARTSGPISTAHGTTATCPSCAPPTTAPGSAPASSTAPAWWTA